MTPFERAIWEKANRERREAQDKANRERREAQDRLDVERRAARDKYVSDLRRQLDKLRQELRDAATSQRKGQIQAAIESASRRLEEVEDPSAAMIAAGREASAEKVEKARGDARGLAFCDRAGMAKRVGQMMADFDLGLSESVGLIEPEMPAFLAAGAAPGMWGAPGWYDLNTSLERWIGPEAAGQVAVEGTYYRATSEAAFDAMWGAWLETIGPIDNILWNANELANFFKSLVGNRGLDRGVWRPGRLAADKLSEAIATVHPEGSLAWNEAFSSIPTPPGSITLTTFSDPGFTYPDSHGDFFLMSKRRPENHDSSGTGFEVAQELWGTWLDDLSASYQAMLEAREMLRASRPALERALEAFRPFGLGTQYPFRGY